MNLKHVFAPFFCCFNVFFVFFGGGFIFVSITVNIYTVPVLTV